MTPVGAVLDSVYGIWPGYDDRYHQVSKSTRLLVRSLAPVGPGTRFLFTGRQDIGVDFPYVARELLHRVIPGKGPGVVGQLPAQGVILQEGCYAMAPEIPPFRRLVAVLAVLHHIVETRRLHTHDAPDERRCVGLRGHCNFK